ncbi:beta/gamma crystallin domain-containing protein 1 isoform X3 [Hypomesus transpacificus]|uniref:beta/gamma crystallin domain-containing protein 1 isoform X3 n=1 Tax=Hypomesus transpacificus TaxID=137520 RepID=UPI001F077BA4|nr:beta/gamma crystallin domain-containing protein 1 isoform X3 [Hypomesus transpacificus]
MSGVSREGGGTFPGRSGRASPDSGVTAQVAAKLPVTETHKHAFPDTLVEREEREDRFPETNLSQLARSVNASADPSPAVEQPGLQTQLIRADLDSDAEMNSSYDIQSTLSSTFTLRPSPTSEGSPPNEFKHRIHKVSLVSEDASASAAPESVDLRGIRTDPEPGGAEVDLRGIRTDPEPGGAEVDLRGIRTDPEPGGAEVDLRGIRTDPEPGGAEVGPPAAGYKWKQFDVEIPSTPEPTGEESDFLSSTSSSLSLSQTGLYTRHLTYPSPLSPETPGLHGNMGRPSDSSKVQLSSVSKAGGGTGAEGGWRSRRDWAEPKAPAGEETGEGDREAVERGTQWNKSGWDSQRLPVSGVSPAAAHHGQDIYHKDFAFSGVFTATRVELTPDLSPSSPLTPVTPDPSSPYQQDMENMMGTLKSMDRPKRSCSLRGVPPSLFSSLPPIVEDAFSPNSTLGPATTLAHSPPAPGAPDKAHNGGPPSSLPVDLGIKWSSPKDKLSPLEMMKLQQKQESVGDKNPGFIPTRRSTLGSDSSHDSSPSYLNGGGGGVNPLTPGSTSRLDNSFLFSGYRQGSMEQPSMENDEAKAYLSRASSLSDIGPSNDRLSFSSIGIPKTGTGTVAGTGTDNTVPSRYERLSFLVSSSSLTGAPDSNSRISRPSTLQLLSSPTSTGERTFSSPSHLHSPTAPSDLQRNFSMEALTARFNHNQAQNLAQTQGMGAMNGMGGSVGSIGSMGLQRSFSTEGTSGGGGTLLFNNVHGGSHFNPEPEPEKIQMVPKYRAFPDAYLTKEKEHGKLNPRPGKMFIFDEAGMCGQRIEVRGDVIDATPWQLQETISIRVIRGGWVLYEKPNFKGEKIALDEGDIEITYPFGPPEEGMEDGQQQQQQSGQTAQREQNGTREQNGEKENGEKENGGQEGEEGNTIPVRRFIIGSIRRAVRDYSVPEISLFPEENAEGKKVTFRDTCEDARIFGFPIKANSIIINAGLWLVYAEPFFQGIPKVLEVGGFHNPAAWGVEQPYVGSVHPLKIGEPRVEKPNEAKLVIYEKPYFTGKTRTIYSNMKDFMTRVERSQIAFMYSAGSIKVQGGCWVGHEKEGFRGYQYLLEEGEYHDWRVWGGHNAELRSIRVLRADLTEPMLVMFEQPEGEAEEGQQEEENSFEVTEAIPDVELFGYRPTTRSINILSGAWVAYSHVDYSGEQYILEKGFYNNCADWGSQDNRICSIQPILLAAGESHGSRNEVVLYSETDFQGECHMYDEAQETLADRLLAKSCRVMGGSWVMYDAKSYKGDLYVLSEGDYPNFSSMGCPSSYVIRSLKPVPQMLSLPSISLFGLECLEGREITIDTDMVNMLEEGYNNHTLSLRVNSGSWVVCEHSNYRGRQFLLETIEIPNWPKFSQLHTIGSMYPVRQRRRFFRIKNKERGHFLSIQGGVEELKSGRVVVMETVEGMSEIWFYQDGLIKNKLAPSMSLQVMGNVEAGAKVVLWSETRQPVQTWSAQMSGAVVSLTFPGMVLDIKGGKTYDKNFAVIMPKSEERPCQQWELEIL